MENLHLQCLSIHLSVRTGKKMNKNLFDVTADVTLIRLPLLVTVGYFRYVSLYHERLDCLFMLLCLQLALNVNISQLHYCTCGTPATFRRFCICLFGVLCTPIFLN